MSKGFEIGPPTTEIRGVSKSPRTLNNPVFQISEICSGLAEPDLSSEVAFLLHFALKSLGWLIQPPFYTTYDSQWRLSLGSAGGGRSKLRPGGITQKKNIFSSLFLPNHCAMVVVGSTRGRKRSLVTDVERLNCPWLRRPRPEMDRWMDRHTNCCFRDRAD